MRAGGFPAPDEPLDAAGAQAAAALRALAGEVLTSPAPAARQTAEALGGGAVDEALRDIHHGAWTGRRFAEIAPAELAGWIADPAAGAPGGEPLEAVVERIRPWLEARSAASEAVIAVTHPMVIRAALAGALDLPAPAVMRIDIAPLSQARLSFNGVWRLQALVPPT